MGLRLYFVLVSIVAVLILLAVTTGLYAKIGLDRWIEPIFALVLVFCVVLWTGIWFATKNFGIKRVAIASTGVVMMLGLLAIYFGLELALSPPTGIPSAPKPPLPLPAPPVETEARVPTSPTAQTPLPEPKLPVPPPVVIPNFGPQPKSQNTSKSVILGQITIPRANEIILSEATIIPRRPSAYWNTWFEYQDEPAPAALTVDKVYTFVLDLSPFEYAKLRTSPAQSTGVDPSIDKLVSDQNIKQLTFQVRPLLAEGGGLSFGAGVPADTMPLKAELRRNSESKLRRSETIRCQSDVATRIVGCSESWQSPFRGSYGSAGLCRCCAFHFKRKRSLSTRPSREMGPNSAAR